MGYGSIREYGGWTEEVIDRSLGPRASIVAETTRVTKAFLSLDRLAARQTTWHALALPTYCRPAPPSARIDIGAVRRRLGSILSVLFFLTKNVYENIYKKNAKKRDIWFNLRHMRLGLRKLPGGINFSDIQEHLGSEGDLLCATVHL